jgi:hypothetical protein
MTRQLLSLALLFAALVPAATCQAASNSSWNGTWAGLLNNSEPVSVTIAGGRVVGYAIRGGAPFGIQYSRVTLTTVSFGDSEHYTVRMTKRGERTALGFAHSPLGDGSASLTRQ